MKVDRPITDEAVAAKYNNFYEFGSTKSIWEAAQALPTENWKVEVTGLVRNPRTYDLDDLKKKFPLEERVYRFRCVEAWAMVVPWLGFPMRRIIDDVEPTSEARFVRFISYYNRKITKGPGLSLSRHPWPYTEGLRTDEMANELAFFAIGIYWPRTAKAARCPHPPSYTVEIWVQGSQIHRKDRVSQLSTEDVLEHPSTERIRL